MPMSCPDADVWIAFNGEIYNHHALRAELSSRGHRFRTSTDTEVLIHAYLAWGDGFVARLNGMFAFVIHDGRRGRVLAARDRFGTKPLYYAVEPDWVGFGSDFGILRKFVAPSRRGLSDEALAAVVALRYVPWRGPPCSRSLHSCGHPRCPQDGF
jgi:asparagine synthase (glutamine-hydrolysing)